jgi:hypothetical protein
MKPTRSILDPTFRYIPAIATSVAETWARFGWLPPRRAPAYALVKIPVKR